MSKNEKALEDLNNEEAALRAEMEAIESTKLDFHTRLAEIETERTNRLHAERLFGIYKAHLDAGFTKDQAWDLFMATMSRSLR